MRAERPLTRRVRTADRPRRAGRPPPRRGARPTSSPSPPERGERPQPSACDPSHFADARVTAARSGRPRASGGRPSSPRAPSSTASSTPPPLLPPCLTPPSHPHSRRSLVPQRRRARTLDEREGAGDGFRACVVGVPVMPIHRMTWETRAPRGRVSLAGDPPRGKVPETPWETTADRAAG